MKECNLKKTTNSPKIRGCLPTHKKVFFLFFFVVVLFSFCSVCLFFLWKGPERLFPAVLEAFTLLLPKRLVFNIPLFFLFQFFSLFSFCLPFQHSILFLWFLSINPFLENILFSLFVMPLFCCRVFCFCLSVFMLALFLVCFALVIVLFLLCFLFRLLKNTDFPTIRVLVLVMLVKRYSVFSCFMIWFWLSFFLCCLFAV